MLNLLFTGVRPPPFSLMIDTNETGPNPELDRLWMTWGYREQRRTYYNQEWHTYGFEWNEEYLWTYIDSRVAQVISLRFKESFWKKGNFPTTVTNTTTGEIQRLTNPWITSENNVAPFDQRMSALHFIMNDTDV
jgi:hypothetical protein